MEPAKLIVTWLSDASRSLTTALDVAGDEGAVDAGSLRVLQRQLESLWPYINQPLDTLIVLFVPLFIADVFANLFGDTPYYPEVVGARRDVLRTTADALASLSRAYDGGDVSAVTESLATMADGYRLQVVELNLVLPGGATDGVA